MTGLGVEAVMVFFVLSGYLIGGRAIIQAKTKGFDAVDYFTHRVSRIYTVLIPALIVGGALDLIGLTYFNHSGLYTISSPFKTESPDFSVDQNLSWPIFLVNLLNLQTVLAPHLGSNSPLWSLANEWWYYCIFAAAMLAVAKTNGVARQLTATAAVLAMCLLLPHPLVLWMLIWLIGVGTALYCQVKSWRPSPWVAGLFFCSTVIISKLISHQELATDRDSLQAFAGYFIVGLGYAAFLVSFDRNGPEVLFAPAYSKLARFSFTLYLVHFPMMMFSVAVLTDVLRIPFAQQPGPASIAYYLCLVALLVLYAWGFSMLTENHTGKIRLAISGLIRKPSAKDVAKAGAGSS